MTPRITSAALPNDDLAERYSVVDAGDIHIAPRRGGA